MNPKAKKGRYPHTRARVYTSAVTFVLSVILVVLLLQSSLTHILYYFVSTVAITSAIFALEVRFLSLTAPKASGEKILPTKKADSQWKLLLLLFSIILLSLIIPLLLTQFLSPEIWFVLIVSFTSGASIAEVLFYFHTR